MVTGILRTDSTNLSNAKSEYSLLATNLAPLEVGGLKFVPLEQSLLS